TVSARSPGFRTVCSSVVRSNSLLLPSAARIGAVARSSLTGIEPAAREPADVVREPDDEQERDEHEADDADLLECPVRRPPAADLLEEPDHHVPPVERQEGEEI